MSQKREDAFEKATEGDRLQNPESTWKESGVERLRPARGAAQEFRSQIPHERRKNAERPWRSRRGMLMFNLDESG